MIRQFTFCLVVLVVACLSYVGYREYQQHIEFEKFIAQVDSSAVAELFPLKWCPAVRFLRQQSM